MTTTNRFVITETTSTPAIWARAASLVRPIACLVCGQMAELDDSTEIVYRKKTQGYACSSACMLAAVNARN